MIFSCICRRDSLTTGNKTDICCNHPGIALSHWSQDAVRREWPDVTVYALWVVPFLCLDSHSREYFQCCGNFSPNAFLRWIKNWNLALYQAPMDAKTWATKKKNCKTMVHLRHMKPKRNNSLPVLVSQCLPGFFPCIEATQFFRLKSKCFNG